MSRTMNESIEKLIKKVLDQVDEPSIKSKKYTIGGDGNAVSWLKDLKILQKLRLFPSFHSALGLYQNKQYLILVNHQFENTAKIPVGLQEEELNAGAWIAIIDELDLPIIDHNASCLEELLGSDLQVNESGYQQISYDFRLDNSGFSLQDVFPSIDIYKIDGSNQQSKFFNTSSLSRLTGLLLVESKKYYLLPYSQDVLARFKDLFENDQLKLLFENVLVSYAASDYKFCYLDLYRCIERVQPLLFFQDFYTELKSSSSGFNKTLEEFCIDFYDKTKLQPKLDSSLERLVQPIMNNFTPKYRKITSADLYNLRNQIVHLRPGQTNRQANSLIPDNDDDWNKLIEDMLQIIKEIYIQHDKLID